MDPQSQYSNLNYQPKTLPEGYAPRKNDVLCGRGKGNSLHEGNRMFTQTIRANLQTYLRAPSRLDKSIVIASLASSMQQDLGVKFIKFDPKLKRYMEISKDEVHEKIGHAIRAILRQKNSSLHQDAPDTSAANKKTRRPYGSYSASATKEDDTTHKNRIEEGKVPARKLSVGIPSETLVGLTSQVTESRGSRNAADVASTKPLKMVPPVAAWYDNLNQETIDEGIPEIVPNPFLPAARRETKSVHTSGAQQEPPDYGPIFAAPAPGESFYARSFFEEEGLPGAGETRMVETKKSEDTSQSSSTRESSAFSALTPQAFENPLSPVRFALSPSIALDIAPRFDLNDSIHLQEPGPTPNDSSTPMHSHSSSEEEDGQNPAGSGTHK